jgi:hypothetical protein
MTYVPVKLWVPDTTEGPTMESVNLKLCDQCQSPVLEGQQDAHDASVHPPPPEVTPHA